MEKNTKGVVDQMYRITSTVTAFKLLLVVMLLCFVVMALGFVYFYSMKVTELTSNVYVLEQGAAFSARAQDESVSRRDEVYDHMVRFSELMFNIPPSTDMIKRNLNRVLEMSDKSVYRYYNDLSETGFYKRMTSTNSYQQVDITSVDIDMDSYPFVVTVTGFTYISRESNISKFSLAYCCKVENSVRSLQNLHGLMITDFQVLDNKLLETRDK